MKGKVKWALSAQDKSCSPPLPTIECCFLSNWNRLCILIMTFFSMVQSLCSSLSFIIYILHFCDWIYIYHECTDPFTWRRWYWIFLLKTIVIITPGNSPGIKKLKRRNRDMSYFDLRQSPRCTPPGTWPCSRTGRARWSCSRWRRSCRSLSSTSPPCGALCDRLGKRNKWQKVTQGEAKRNHFTVYIYLFNHQQ